MRYILYSFPAFHGDPKPFATKIGAWLYAKRKVVLGSMRVYELKDTKTGKYLAYWVA